MPHAFRTEEPANISFRTVVLYLMAHAIYKFRTSDECYWDNRDHSYLQQLLPYQLIVVVLSQFSCKYLSTLYCKETGNGYN